MFHNFRQESVNMTQILVILLCNHNSYHLEKSYYIFINNRINLKSLQQCILFYRLAKFSLIDENPRCILCLLDLILFSTLPASAALDSSFLKNEGSCFFNRAASSSFSFNRCDLTFLDLCSSLQFALSIIS